MTQEEFFLAALKFILAREGGYVDDPVDRGGATNFGVTQGAYDSYLARHDRPEAPVLGITTEDVRAVYFEDYWVAGKCDKLPWPLSLAHFDSFVQHNPRSANKILQRALAVVVDGKVGRMTLAAAKVAPAVWAVRVLLAERKAYYRAIVIKRPEQSRFLKGWENRIEHLRDATEV